MGTVRPSRDWIALVLAVGLCTALNVIVVAILWDAIHDPSQAGISENATQILTGWGGGIVGILGAVFGARLADGTNGGTDDVHVRHVPGAAPGGAGDRDDVV